MKTNLNDDHRKKHESAVKYLKLHRKELIAKYVDSHKFVTEDLPVSIFMAGSPGAGKTEFSKGLIEQFKGQPIRIDADDIRDFFEDYDKTNSHIFQGACALGVEKLYDEALKRGINLILDGTFAKRDISIKNIERSLKKRHKVQIYYIYQDPKTAWDFTQKRAVVEGRRVPKGVFIDAFIQAKDNVNFAKAKFGKDVELNLVIKDIENKNFKVILNIDKIDNYLKFKYNLEALEGVINEDIS